MGLGWVFGLAGWVGVGCLLSSVCVLLRVGVAGVGVALRWGFGLIKPREFHASVCLFCSFL